MRQIHLVVSIVALAATLVHDPRNATACNSTAECWSYNSTGTSYFEQAKDATDALDVNSVGTGKGLVATSNSGDAVVGTATLGRGVYATSSGNDAIKGTSTSATNAGVSGTNSNGGYGVYASVSSGGDALYATAATGNAAYFNGNISVNGTPYCNGCTAFTNNSDSRLKKNIRPLGGTLAQLLKLRGVTFEWIDPAAEGKHEGMQRGFIAQDVEKVLPEWVGVDAQGFKTLNMTGIEPMLVESIRELKDRADKADARADKADARADKAEARIEAIENARRPISFNPNWGILTAGLVIGGVILVNKRRKREESDQK